ncbi:MAG: hypothetical protein A2X25_14735 [Chloroflexi bacterium GWB2_49_20]|nr:MAG: hypothetical protein A2X25_14735 [Chloroflexi bacterium GWB2_49_20]OGN83549.1 MAG: hypothetical protein A2X27_11360 [Chloroflexi bacterium GWD2_49_16]
MLAANQLHSHFHPHYQPIHLLLHPLAVVLRSPVHPTEHYSIIQMCLSHGTQNQEPPNINLKYGVGILEGTINHHVVGVEAHHVM